MASLPEDPHGEVVTEVDTGYARRAILLSDFYGFRLRARRNDTRGEHL
jgi:hypothetical protein